MSPNSRAALFMIVAMAAFTLNDACVKYLGSSMPLFQLVTLRGILASFLLLSLAFHMQALRFDFSRTDWGLIAVRAIAESAATYFFLTALLYMPLANVTAVLQVLPLTVTLGAMLFFREQVGWQRMLAIAFGFAGMLLIVRPGPDGFSIHAMNALGAVICVTFRDLVTRRMSANVPSLTVTFLSSLSVLAFGAVMSTATPWVSLDMGQIGIIVLAAIFVLGGYLFGTLVMRAGDVSFSAPFRYTGLVWALVLGWLIFGDWPDRVTMLGALIVVLSGLFAFYRERTRA